MENVFSFLKCIQIFWLSYANSCMSLNWNIFLQKLSNSSEYSHATCLLAATFAGKEKKITFHICRAGQDVFLLFSKSGRTIICIVLALFKRTLRAVALWAFKKDPCAITLCTFQKRPLVLKFLIFPKRPFLLLALLKNTNSAIIFDFFLKTLRTIALCAFQKDPSYYRANLGHQATPLTHFRYIPDFTAPPPFSWEVTSHIHLLLAHLLEVKPSVCVCQCKHTVQCTSHQWAFLWCGLSSIQLYIDIDQRIYFSDRRVSPPLPCP